MDKNNQKKRVFVIDERNKKPNNTHNVIFLDAAKPYQKICTVIRDLSKFKSNTDEQNKILSTCKVLKRLSDVEQIQRDEVKIKKLIETKLKNSESCVVLYKEEGFTKAAEEEENLIHFLYEVLDKIQ